MEVQSRRQTCLSSKWGTCFVPLDDEDSDSIVRAAGG